MVSRWSQCGYKVAYKVAYNVIYKVVKHGSLKSILTSIIQQHNYTNTIKKEIGN